MFLNRELSWLAFNERVLMEMKAPELELGEKLKFSAIFSSNLDEFFMVRVAAIQNQVAVGYTQKDPSGLSPKDKIVAIHAKIRSLVETQYDLTMPILKQLSDSGVEIIRKNQYHELLTQDLESYFVTDVFPVLTPMAVDFTRRFPLVANKQLHVAVKLMVGTQHKLAIVQVPSVLDRWIRVRKDGAKWQYVLLEDVISTFVERLFLGHKVLSTCIFRVTRNADLKIVEDEAEDLLMVIEEAVKLRKWGETVRMEIEKHVDPWLSKVLQDALMLDSTHIYEIDGLLDLSALFRLKLPKSSKSVFKAPKHGLLNSKSLFKQIREKDFLLHHPFDAFDPVVEFIRQASKDPGVLAIKQTLYRVSGDSQIVKALTEAAEKGKQVTVLVELRARFDEENNILWAKKLEQKGVHVIYGIMGLKTHSKITLVVRKEKNKIRRYLHLSTGNYNDITAKLYTDMGFFTCRENFGADASVFFNMVSGFTSFANTHVFGVAPYTLRQRLTALIQREIEYAKKGKKAVIRAKINALVDVEIIEKLYEASQAGVRIQLIVRGICTLVPGIEGLSDNIEVISVVGEFLEHSRVYTFHNAGATEVYLSSADWMTRNLDRRIELMFPIEDAELIEKILLTMKLYLKDNVKSWVMQSDGSYLRKKNSGKAVHAQDVLKQISHEPHERFSEVLKNLL